MRRWTTEAVAAERPNPVLQIGLLAGLAGGLVEALRLSAYTAGTRANAASVARVMMPRAEEMHETLATEGEQE